MSDGTLVGHAQIPPDRTSTHGHSHHTRVGPLHRTARRSLVLAEHHRTRESSVVTALRSALSEAMLETHKVVVESAAAALASELEHQPKGGWPPTHVALGPLEMEQCSEVSVRRESPLVHPRNLLGARSACTAGGRRSEELGACCCSWCSFAATTATCYRSGGVLPVVVLEGSRCWSADRHTESVPAAMAW